MTKHHRGSTQARHGTARPEILTRLYVRVVVSILAVTVGLLATTSACRADEPDAESKTESSIEPGLIELDEGIPTPPKIKPKYVKRGEVIQINSMSNTVWVVIPSPYFSRVSGGSDWAIGEEMIAFKIDHGFARVKLADDFPPSDEEQSIYYSILFFDGQTFAYQEGESPPRMIIPPSLPR